MFDEYPEPPEWVMDPDGTPPAPLYADVAAYLDAGIPAPPRPVALRREDGHALFYASKVNVLFGDPESGKSWIAYAAVTQVLQDGRNATIVDVDHNGMREVITRLLALGAPPSALRDPGRFRYYEPEDRLTLAATVFEHRDFRPALTVVDSLGEVVPMLGYNSNSPDEYSRAHREVLTGISAAGTCVVAIDHMPKSDDARQHGQTGTLAKKRAVNGTSLRVTVRDTFAPGRGGSASLVITKDRPGGLRATCPVDGKYQPAGLFVMTPRPDGTIDWKVTTPRVGDSSGGIDPGDVAELDCLQPPPKSVRDIKTRLGWGTGRASAALSAWRSSAGVEAA